MKRILILAVPVSIFTLFIGLCVLVGCKKTETPLGLNAPYGFDVPTKTPTPAVGAINVYVQDGGEKAGVTVISTDPSSNSVTVVSGNYGPVVFNPFPILNGVYNITIPTQGKYYLSTAAITEISNGPEQSVTFQGGVENVTLNNSAPQSYGTNFPVSFIYNLTYNPNTPYVPLYCPVSIHLNSLPSVFNAAPASLILGAGVTTAPVTINKTNCYVQSVPMTWTCTDFLGEGVSPPPISSIQRGYTIPVVVVCSGAVTGKDVDGNTNLTYNVALTTSTNDCGTYSFSVNFQNSSEALSNTQYFSLTNGHSFTYSMDPYQNYGGTYLLAVNCTTPTGLTFSGGFTPGGTFDNTVVNTSY